MKGRNYLDYLSDDEEDSRPIRIRKGKDVKKPKRADEWADDWSDRRRDNKKRPQRDRKVQE